HHEDPYCAHLALPRASNPAATAPRIVAAQAAPIARNSGRSVPTYDSEGSVCRQSAAINEWFQRHGTACASRRYYGRHFRSTGFAGRIAEAAQRERRERRTRGWYQ